MWCVPSHADVCQNGLPAARREVLWDCAHRPVSSVPTIWAACGCLSRAARLMPFLGSLQTISKWLWPWRVRSQLQACALHTGKRRRGWLKSCPFACNNTIISALQGIPRLHSHFNGALMRVSPLGMFGALCPDSHYEMGQKGRSHYACAPCLCAGQRRLVCGACGARRTRERHRLEHYAVFWGPDKAHEAGVCPA